MAKNILPLIRPLDEIKADLELKNEEAQADLEILYSDAEALELLIQPIMANKRLAAEIASRWVREHDFYFMDKNFWDHWYMIPKQPPKSS